MLWRDHNTARNMMAAGKVETLAGSRSSGNKISLEEINHSWHRSFISQENLFLFTHWENDLDCQGRNWKKLILNFHKHALLNVNGIFQVIQVGMAVFVMAMRTNPLEKCQKLSLLHFLQKHPVQGASSGSKDVWQTQPPLARPLLFHGCFMSSVPVELCVPPPLAWDWSVSQHSAKCSGGQFQVIGRMGFQVLMAFGYPLLICLSSETGMGKW